MGLWVDKDGSLVNVKDGSVIEKHLIAKDLRRGLDLNGINFEEDYDRWDKWVYTNAVKIGIYYKCHSQ